MKNEQDTFFETEQKLLTSKVNEKKKITRDVPHGKTSKKKHHDLTLDTFVNPNKQMRKINNFEYATHIYMLFKLML